jgi:ribonuclease Z
MMPMPYRLLASMAARIDGRIYLFDAGEGTQLGWKKARLGYRGLHVIAVTHLHADHCLGIPGLMMLRSQMDSPPPLTIIGPPGIEEFIQLNRKALEFHVNYPVLFVEWNEDAPEMAYEDEAVRIFWHPLQHTRFCLGYRLEERDRPGKFNARRAESLGIPQGPLWGKLQRGETVLTETGKEISPEQVLGPPRPGRRLAYVVDTLPVKGIYRLCKDTDIAFMEGMFLPEDAQHADAKGHMTVTDAARIAGRAGVKQAVLTHISPRYHDEDLERLEAAAKERFEKVSIGRDLDTYSVALKP